MKKYLILLISACVFVSCNKIETQPVVENSNTTNQSVSSSGNTVVVENTPSNTKEVIDTKVGASTGSIEQSSSTSQDTASNDSNTGEIVDTGSGEKVMPALNNSVSNSSTLRPEGIISKIRSNFESKYILLNSDENTNLKINELRITLTEKSPYFKVDGYNFYTTYNGGSMLEIRSHNPNPTDYEYPKDNDVVVRNAVIDAYKSFNLVYKETRGDKLNSTDTDVYIGDGVICSIESPNSMSSINTASCGLIEKYEAEAEKIKPIADVIPSLDSSSEMILADLAVTNSRVSGYQKAGIGIGSINGGGAFALLYKKDSGPWVYFMGAQDTPHCSQFNSQDLKNAFMGDECFTKDTQISSVQ